MQSVGSEKYYFASMRLNVMRLILQAFACTQKKRNGENNLFISPSL
jgi:hypothetical protein